MTMYPKTSDVCGLTLDFHSHILPGVDHGSDSVETSLYQLHQAEKFGITHICATSHFYPEKHDVESFVKLRSESYKRLSDKLFDGCPKIHLGAEVLMCAGIESMPGISNLLIEGTNTLLLELPFTDFSTAYCDSVYSLVRDGIDVVLAHAERYNESNIDMLIDNGARIQLNADAFRGVFVPRRVKRWLAGGHVVALGSDIHMYSKHSYMRYRRAERRIGSYITPLIEYQNKIIE